MATGGVVRPPDGGWGWLVVLGSFLCNVIVDGIIFSYGLFIPELAEDLGESKGRLAWVGSLLAGCYLIAGPLVSGLANTYGCRPVTIAGAFISSASFAIASFAPNMECLCLTFGVMGGIGFGFIYLPAVVTVGFYFERRRALATGLAVCGSGVGTFLVAPLVRHLLSQYGWRGTLLVLAGMVLNCAAFGALFRPLLAPESPEPDEGQWKETELRQVSMSMPELTYKSETLPSECPTTSDENNSPPPSYSDVIGAEEEEMLTFLHLPSLLQKTNAPTMSLERLTTGRKLNLFSSSLQKLNPLSSFRQQTAMPSLQTMNGASSTKRLPSAMQPRYGDLSRPFYRQDILYSASLLHLPEFKKLHQNMAAYAASVTKIPEETEGSCCSAAMKESFRQMLDMSLLRSPTFLLLAAGGFLTLAGLFIPFMFAGDRADSLGISPSQVAYFLPVVGFTNTVGRVFCGWISDMKNLDALALNNASLLLGGLATALCACIYSGPLLLAYGAVFGFSIGCFATLRSIVIVDLLGLDKLTNAFGLLLLFQGIASMVGAPISGMFYDATGSYDSSFYLSGSLIFVSGLLGLPLRCLSRWEKRQKNSLHTDVIVSSCVLEEQQPFDPEPV